jgi:hypothetical protein
MISSPDATTSFIFLLSNNSMISTLHDMRRYPRLDGEDEDKRGVSRSQGSTVLGPDEDADQENGSNRAEVEPPTQSQRIACELPKKKENNPIYFRHLEVHN